MVSCITSTNNSKWFQVLLSNTNNSNFACNNNNNNDGDTNGSPNFSQTTRSRDSQPKKKRTYRIVDLPFRLTTG